MKDSKQSELEDLILSTLSFYEPMNFERIILDLNESDLVEYPEFNRQDLQDILHKLVKSKKIKVIKKKKETHWQRIFKKRSLWGRIRKLLR